MMALIGQEVFGMTKEVQREIQRKLRVLQHAERTGQVSKTCRYFGIGRASCLSPLELCHCVFEEGA